MSKKIISLFMIITFSFSTVFLGYIPRSKAGVLDIFSPDALDKALQAVVTGLTVSAAFVLNQNYFWTSDTTINDKTLQAITPAIAGIPAAVKEDFAAALQTKYTTNNNYLDVPDSLVAWANTYVQSKVIGTMIAGIPLEDLGQGVSFDGTNYYANLKNTTVLPWWPSPTTQGTYKSFNVGTKGLAEGANVTSSNLSHVFMNRSSLLGYSSIILYQYGKSLGQTNPTYGVRSLQQVIKSSTSIYVTGSNSQNHQNGYSNYFETNTWSRGNDALAAMESIFLEGAVNLQLVDFNTWADITAKQSTGALNTPDVDKVKIPMVMTPTATGAIDVVVPIPKVVDLEGDKKLAIPTGQTTTGEWDWTGELANPIDGTIVKEGTTTTNPPVDPPIDGNLDLSNLVIAGNLFTTKFPFSIPWDIARQLSIFNVAPQAPVLNVDKSINVFGTTMKMKFDIDFSIFDDLAKIVRWFLVIAFDIGIILAMRKFMPE